MRNVKVFYCDEDNHHYGDIEHDGDIVFVDYAVVHGNIKCTGSVNFNGTENYIYGNISCFSLGSIHNLVVRGNVEVEAWVSIVDDFIIYGNLKATDEITIKSSLFILHGFLCGEYVLIASRHYYFDKVKKIGKHHCIDLSSFSTKLKKSDIYNYYHI